MLAWLERNPFLLIAFAGLVLLSGLAARDLLGGSEPAGVVLRGSAMEPGTPLRVHVAGAVAVPGVYGLEAGDRVEDALAAAGGAVDGADLDAINLARRVRDGERIRVPSAVRAAPTLAPGEVLDLNLATREELIALPGIGEAYSTRIVDSRAADGPFASVDDVLERNLLPQRTLDGIRDLVTVSSP